MSLHRMKLYSLLRLQSSTLTRSFETLWLLSGYVHSKTLKPQLNKCTFPTRPTTLSATATTRHTVYYVTVRSRTSCSSTNEDQVYLCVPTEQRRLVAKRTRKILHGVFSFLKNLVWTSTSRDSLSFLNLFLSLASGPPYGDQWAPFS